MKVFPERVKDLSLSDPEIVKKFQPCMKKPIPIKAVQMDVSFRVKTMEGDFKQGKPGDYLMCGIDGEMYICDQDIFVRTYDWL